jgi:hypothetical protein
MLDWPTEHVNWQVKRADIVLTSPGVRWLVVEALGQVKSQRGLAKARPVIKAEVRVEADSVGDCGEVLGEQRVAEGQQAVDDVPRRPPVTSIEVESCAGQPELGANHRGKRLEVEPCGPLDAEQRRDRSRLGSPRRELLQRDDRRFRSAPAVASRSRRSLPSTRCRVPTSCVTFVSRGSDRRRRSLRVELLPTG